MSNDDLTRIATGEIVLMADDIRAIRCTLENLEKLLNGLGEQATAAVDAMGNGGGVFGILRSLMG